MRNSINPNTNGRKETITAHSRSLGYLLIAEDRTTYNSDRKTEEKDKIIYLKI